VLSSDKSLIDALLPSTIPLSALPCSAERALEVPPVTRSFTTTRDAALFAAAVAEDAALLALVAASEAEDAAAVFAESAALADELAAEALDAAALAESAAFVADELAAEALLAAFDALVLAALADKAAFVSLVLAFASDVLAFVELVEAAAADALALLAAFCMDGKSTAYVNPVHAVFPSPIFSFIGWPAPKISKPISPSARTGLYEFQFAVVSRRGLIFTLAICATSIKNNLSYILCAASVNVIQN
jgi:hypothetical protein